MVGGLANRPKYLTKLINQAEARSDSDKISLFFEWYK